MLNAENRPVHRDYYSNPSGHQGRHRDNRDGTLITGEYRDLRASTEPGYYVGRRRAARAVVVR